MRIFNITLCKDGIVFPYHGDFLTYIFPWRRATKHKFSSVYLQDRVFISLRDYWQSMGIAEASISDSKVSSKSILGVIQFWAKVYLRSGYYVVLYDVDVSQKDAHFWETMGEHRALHFTNDIVILKCKDSSQVDELCTSIPRRFAASLGVVDGVIIESNFHDY